MKSHLANASLPPVSQVPPGTSAVQPPTQGEGLSSAQATALLAESNQRMDRLTAAVNAVMTGPTSAPSPCLRTLLSAVPAMCRSTAQLTDALLQVGTSALISNEGRRAA